MPKGKSHLKWPSTRHGPGKKGPRHPLPKEDSKGKRHKRKLLKRARGEPRDHTHPWIAIRRKPVVDRRAEAAAWAKKRRAMVEVAPRLRVLFNEEYIRRFEGSFGWHLKACRGESKVVAVEGDFRIVPKYPSEKEVQIGAVGGAIHETFSAYRGILDLYDKFCAESGKYKFEAFQQWAKGIIQKFGGPES